MLRELIRNKVDFEGVTARALKAAADDPTFRSDAVALFAGRPHPAPETIAFLLEIATSKREAVSLRAQALRGLMRAGEPRVRRCARWQRFADADNPPGELLGAWSDFVRDNRHRRALAEFVTIAEGADRAAGVVGYAVLAALASDSRDPSKPARGALDRAWQKPETTVRLLRALALDRGRDSRPTSRCA